MTNMFVLFDLVHCLARLDVHVERAKKLSFCWIGPCGFKIIFHGSTFVVLVLQINGVWVAGSNGGTRLDAGADFLDVGFSVNLFFLLLFFLFLVHFDWRRRREYRCATSRERPWCPVICALYFSWTFMMVSQSQRKLILCSYLFQYRSIRGRVG
jgi:RTA1 like protein